MRETGRYKDSQVDNRWFNKESESRSVMSDSVILWTVACQAPLSMGFSRPEYSPGDLPNSGIKPRSSTLQADSLLSESPGKSKNTGVGSLALLQQIFLTKELKRGLPAMQADSLPAELPGNLLFNKGAM